MNSFHGRTVTTLAATGQDVFHEHFWPFTEGFSYARANDFESLLSCVTENTCAVLIELIQGEGASHASGKEFVRKTAALCKEKDILLMVDEVQTGIGRTGSLYCYEQYGIEPDVITSAKGLGGASHRCLPVRFSFGRSAGRRNARHYFWRKSCLPVLAVWKFYKG